MEEKSLVIQKYFSVCSVRVICAEWRADAIYSPPEAPDAPSVSVGSVARSLEVREGHQLHALNTPDAPYCIDRWDNDVGQ